MSPGGDSRDAPADCARWRSCSSHRAKIGDPYRRVKPNIDLKLYRLLYAPCRTIRRSGGTGRRAGFRSQWAQARGGSSPPFGTGKSHQPSAIGRQLVTWNFRLHLRRPRVDPPLQTAHLRKPGGPEEFDRLQRSHSVMTVGDDVGRAVQLAQTRRQLAKRDEPGPCQLHDVPLEWLAHVEQHEIPVA